MNKKIKEIKIDNLNFSFVDLFYQIKKLKKEIIFSKIEKVFQSSKNELILQLFDLNTKEKKYFYVNTILPFIDKNKPKTDRPPAFCEYLRKKITNYRIKDISQPKSDRIYIIKLISPDETKESELIVEMFGKGVILYCENNIIKNLTNQIKTKERILKINKEYFFPETQIDLFEELNNKDIKRLNKNIKKIILENENKDLVHFLAIDLNLGGKFSEEVCLLSKINKEKKINELNEKELNEIIEKIKKLFNKKNEFVLYYNKNTKTLKEISPFDLKSYEKKENIEKLYLIGFDELIKNYLELKENKTQTKNKKNKKIKKYENIIKAQKKELEKNKKEFEVSQKVGEEIYSNLIDLERFMENFNKFREENGWKNTKEIIENKPFYFDKKNKIKVIKVEPKKGKIIIQIIEK